MTKQQCVACDTRFHLFCFERDFNRFTINTVGKLAILGGSLRSDEYVSIHWEINYLHVSRLY